MELQAVGVPGAKTLSDTIVKITCLLIIGDSDKRKNVYIKYVLNIKLHNFNTIYAKHYTQTTQAVALLTSCNSTENQDTNIIVGTDVQRHKTCKITKLAILPTALVVAVTLFHIIMSIQLIKLYTFIITKAS